MDFQIHRARWVLLGWAVLLVGGLLVAAWGVSL